MAYYDNEMDEVLLTVPWTSFTSPSPYLTKFATIPSTSSYVFLATDLSVVFFESLSFSSISNRLRSISLRDKKIMLVDSPDKETIEITLRGVEALMKDGKAGKIEMSKDDYFDAVFHVSNPNFTWLFNTTELRGRSPLEIMTKHLITPLSRVLAQDRGLPIFGDSGVIVSRVLSDSSIIKTMRRLDPSHNPSLSSTIEKDYNLTSTPTPSRSLTQTSTSTIRSHKDEESFIPLPAAQLSRSRTRTDENQPLPPSSSLLPCDEEEDEAVAEEEDESGYDLPPRSLANSQAQAHVPSSSVVPQSTYNSPPVPLLSSPVDLSRRAPNDQDENLELDGDGKGDGEREGEAAKEEENKLSLSTQTPVRKKTKREIEEEEDAQMERRREEMKMRAARGGSQSRLARRKR